MGCDIHTRAERRNSSGNWELLGRVFKSINYQEDMPERIDEDGFEWNVKLSNQPYEGRNYNLFSILADVRNGYGFAGIKTGEGFNPISEPRGIPADISEEGMKFLNSYESDGHSHSYFTLDELTKFDWRQLTIHRGVLSIEEYKALKESGETQPSSWSGGVSGPGIIIIEEDQADIIINSGLNIPNIRWYINYHWSNLYRNCCQQFLETTIPELSKQANNPDDIRIIFFFDN